MGDAADGLALFAEDMRSDDIEVRTRAVGRLGLVAAALGPAAALKELLPLVNGA
jgi:hypothetical protein